MYVFSLHSIISTVYSLTKALIFLAEIYVSMLYITSELGRYSFFRTLVFLLLADLAKFSDIRIFNG